MRQVKWLLPYLLILTSMLLALGLNNTASRSVNPSNKPTSSFSLTAGALASLAGLRPFDKLRRRDIGRDVRSGLRPSAGSTCFIVATPAFASGH